MKCLFMSSIKPTLFFSLYLTYLLESNYVFMSMSDIFQICIFCFSMTTKTILIYDYFVYPDSHISREMNIYIPQTPLVAIISIMVIIYAWKLHIIFCFCSIYFVIDKFNYQTYIEKMLFAAERYISKSDLITIVCEINDWVFKIQIMCSLLWI